MCGQLCGPSVLCDDGSVAVCVDSCVVMVVLLCVCVDSCEDYVMMVVLLCVWTAVWT